MLNIAELDERIEKCLSILEGNPRSQVFAALADAYRKRGEFGRAFSVCKGGLRQHDDYAPAYIVLAKLYQHQNMHDEALSAVRRAIDIDGATRASDFLEAEVLIAMGDAPGAKKIIARLRTNDPHNPAVSELSQHIREMTDKKDHPQQQSPKSNGDFGVSPSVRALPNAPSLDSVAHESLTWDQWAEAIGKLPAVTDAFAVGGNGDMLTGVGDSDDAVSTGQNVAALFDEIARELQQRLHTRLNEIRIEGAHGEVWCQRYDDGKIGFVGASGVAFGAARQAAMTKAERARTDKKIGPSAQ